jgi:hypothetical protein
VTFLVSIAICLSALPVQQCTEATATAFIVAPEHPASVFGCMRHGLLYAAESHLVGAGSYAKVFCRAK